MEKKIRIGIDLTGIWRHSTGIFRYAEEVAKHLLLLPKHEITLEYVLFFSREIHPNFLQLQQHFETVICPTQNELLGKQVWFPAILPHLHLDVIHYPAFPPPYFHLSGPRIIMTFYDTSLWRYAQTQTLAGRLYFRTLLTHGTKTSMQIATLSAHAKSEIGHFLGKRYLDKILIAPGAVRAEFKESVSTKAKQKVRDAYLLPDRYVLTVATIEPRKNLSTLFEAYLHLRQMLGPDCPPLVIAGRKGWHCNDTLKHIEALQEHVHFLGHIPDQDLIALYQMAKCFVFPSLYEGFGLPVVEAMAAGCPVITTTSSSLPEVAGEAAILIDPLNSLAMAEAIKQVILDDTLSQRMIVAGYQQAVKFSWEKTASLYRMCYINCSKQSR